ncbi:E3 ubiquitin-protein ligase makorin-1 [Physocladia obscura]|uniref:E3 ubiquitin-protein ligase makorin-1 n=1 Tax=Physocladia obscura TaxID=109957 RepID=A0AAD5SSW9_9FUNG|nr:E3 ubiquitin-protein ligase makorin-1 [Physocladia obscura]
MNNFADYGSDSETDAELPQRQTTSAARAKESISILPSGEDSDSYKDDSNNNNPAASPTSLAFKSTPTVSIIPSSPQQQQQHSSPTVARPQPPPQKSAKLSDSPFGLHVKLTAAASATSSRKSNSPLAPSSTAKTFIVDRASPSLLGTPGSEAFYETSTTDIKNDGGGDGGGNICENDDNEDDDDGNNDMRALLSPTFNRRVLSHAGETAHKQEEQLETKQQEEPLQCDPDLQAKIEKWTRLRETSGRRFNSQLARSQSFGNPAIMSKLIEFLGLNEYGTNVDEWTAKFPVGIYYDEIAKAQKIASERPPFNVTVNPATGVPNFMGGVQFTSATSSASGNIVAAGAIKGNVNGTGLGINTTNQGKCRNGSSCAFSHSGPVERDRENRVCACEHPRLFFIKRIPYREATDETALVYLQGNCRFGTSCALSHNAALVKEKEPKEKEKEKDVHGQPLPIVAVPTLTATVASSLTSVAPPLQTTHRSIQTIQAIHPVQSIQSSSILKRSASATTIPISSPSGIPATVRATIDATASIPVAVPNSQRNIASHVFFDAFDPTLPPSHSDFLLSHSHSHSNTPTPTFAIDSRVFSRSAWLPDYATEDILPSPSPSNRNYSSSSSSNKNSFAAVNTVVGSNGGYSKKFIGPELFDADAADIDAEGDVEFDSQLALHALNFDFDDDFDQEDTTTPSTTTTTTTAITAVSSAGVSIGTAAPENTATNGNMKKQPPTTFMPYSVVAKSNITPAVTQPSSAAAAFVSAPNASLPSVSSISANPGATLTLALTAVSPTKLGGASGGSFFASPKFGNGSVSIPAPLYAPVAAAAFAAVEYRFLSQPMNSSDDPNDELCPFAYNGLCKFADKCRYLHGLKCPRCQKYCLHPRNLEARDKHLEECAKKTTFGSFSDDYGGPIPGGHHFGSNGSSGVGGSGGGGGVGSNGVGNSVDGTKLSNEMDCVVCFERVLRKRDPRFGLLS